MKLYFTLIVVTEATTPTSDVKVTQYAVLCSEVLCKVSSTIVLLYETV